MDLEPTSCFADLTLAGPQSSDQLVGRAGHGRLPIGQHGGACADEWDSAEAGDQRPSSRVALHHDLKAPARTVGGGVMVARYLRAIAVTVDRCLAARVLSIEVSMTQCGVPR